MPSRPRWPNPWGGGLPARPREVRALHGAADRMAAADQQRAAQALRAVAALAVVLAAHTAPAAPHRLLMLVLCAGYAAAVLAAGPGRHGGRLPGRLLGRRLGAALLVLDAALLCAGVLLTGGPASPLRYLLVIHLCAVCLIGRARPAVAVALAETGVLTVARAGLIPDQPGAGSITDLLALVGALWVGVAVTAALTGAHERHLRLRGHDLEALAVLAESLEGSRDSASVARALLNTVGSAFGIARGVVAAGPETSWPVLATRGLDGHPTGEPGGPGQSAVVQLAHDGHRALIVDGLAPDAEPWLSRLLPAPTRLAVVPLSAEGRSVGALVVEVGSAHPSPPVVAALERAASYAALALRNAWLLEQVQRLAATDGLTTLANRRTFEATLERELARAARGDGRLSLVMLDIDHFKRLNDDFGHLAGDDVLRRAAGALREACRDLDTPARYGGEEFAVVLPGCGRDLALSVAERLRVAMSGTHEGRPVSASAGVACYPEHGGSAHALIRSADAALYRSKRDGRDRSTLAETITLPGDVRERVPVAPRSGS